MREIGGYIEFEHYHGAMLHDNGIKLDCGRSCLAYLIKAKSIRKIAIPSFMCDSVFHLCERYGVQLRYYQVGLDFLPEDVSIEDDEYFYLMNYYGQLDYQTIEYYRDKYNRVIVDNAQSYFDEPVTGVDMFYSCRKFFGVPDGAVLYTDTYLDEDLEQSESWNHMVHLLGRFERPAYEFYSESIRNKKRFIDQKIFSMSKLTENMLHGIDYEYVRNIRTANYYYLFKLFSSINKVDLKRVEGAFAYPLMIKNADYIREKLIAEKIFVPTLWPNVLNNSLSSVKDRKLAGNILPLPCDQRYNLADMEYIYDVVKHNFCSTTENI